MTIVVMIITVICFFYHWWSLITTMCAWSWWLIVIQSYMYSSTSSDLWCTTSIRPWPNSLPHLYFINDLCGNIKAKVRLFADDMIQYHSIHSMADTGLPSPTGIWHPREMRDEVADGIQRVKVPCPDGHKEVEACSDSLLPSATALGQSPAPNTQVKNWPETSTGESMCRPPLPRQTGQAPNT